MDFKTYLAQAERTYHFRVKTVCPLDDDAMSVIERTVAKYDPIEISSVKATVIQRQPLDFPNVKNAEVYMFDLVLGLPVSGYILQNDLRAAMALPEGQIVVRTDNDPLELQTQQIDGIEDMDAAAAKDGMKPAALLTQNDYPEAAKIDAEAYYGNRYNSRFLDYLHTVSQEAAEARKVDAPHPITTWADQPKPDTPADTFNDHIKDIVEPASVKRVSSGTSAKTAPAGNLDSDTTQVRRVFTNGNKVVTRSSDSKPIRKGDK